VAVIIADLHLVAANRCDQMGEKAASNSAKYGITDFDVIQRTYRRIGAFLPRFDARRHRVAALAKTDRLARAQSRASRLAAHQYRLFLDFLFFWFHKPQFNPPKSPQVEALTRTQNRYAISRQSE
jgi:hypothetical protein